MNKEEFNLSDTIDIIEEVLSGGGEFRIYPKGTSMLPLLRQGIDSVVLKRRSDNSVKKHDIAFYRRDSGAFVLHRVMKIEKDGSFTMCGDNQTELEYGINTEQIIGYAGEIYRKDKPIFKNPFYRGYVFIWCIMPYRRFERACRRLLGKIKRAIIK